MKRYEPMRLDQLLAEIEKHQYNYELTSYPASYYEISEETYPKTYDIKLYDEPDLCAEFGDGSNIFSPEEAAAQALLWILERGD
jgi:hypothetical protein